MKRPIKKTVLPAVILVILVISQTVSAAPFQPVDSGPVSQFMYDNFDDNLTDPSLWSIEEVGGPTGSETNQRLEYTVPANSEGVDFRVWYTSTCLLRGDHDVQVDYQLLTWPNANGVRIGLAEYHANMQRISSGRQPYDFAEGPELYLTNFDTAEHVEGITPTSDLSGKLRMQRIGNTINTFYFANGEWVLDASYASPDDYDTGFYLGAWSADSVFMDQEVKIAFDNLIINAGELVCPTTPPAPDLAVTQTADQEAVSTGDSMGFTITITNNGDATANIVTLSDTLPVYPAFSWSVSGMDAAACVLTGGALSCNFGDMPPGAVKTIRLTASEYEYHGKCFDPTIISTATIMAYNQPVSRTATDSITVLCPYALIDISTDTPSVMAGDPVSYTFTISNIGDGNAKDVEAFLDFQTPPGTSWTITDVTPDSAASNCTLGPFGTVTELECLFDQIAPLEEIVIKVTSPTTSQSCGTFGAAGGMSSSNNFWIKTKMYYLTVTCPPPDLVVTQVADHNTVSTGDSMGFTITTTNNGAGIAKSVTLSDTLPVYPEFSWSLSGMDAAACALTAGTLSCNFGDMSPGAVKTIRLTAPEYEYHGKCFDPTIISTPTVMASNEPVSKSTTTSVTVLCPYVFMDINSDTFSVMAGDPISYTFTVGNFGDGNGKDVNAYLDIQNAPGTSWVITDVTPDGAESNCTFGPYTGPYGTWMELECLFDQIAPQEEVIITLTSPTTSESCGTFYASGGLTASNNFWIKGKPYYITVNCTVSHTAQPGEAGTLTLLNGRGQVDFPADLVTVPTTFTYTKQDTPSQDLGSYKFAGISFTLTAIDSAGSPVTTFPASYTMRLTYQDSDWQTAGITDESLLNLAYWDTASGQWMSLLPCEGCALDTAQNTLVVKLNHLTEFALLAPTDTTPPATSASLSPEVGASGWYTGPVTVTLTASDSGLGVQSTEYNLNGTGWTTYSVPFEVSTESASSTVHNIVQYRSTDKAGNVEETKSLTIKIDATTPTIGASVPLSGYAVQGGIKFGVNLADPISGPASAMLSIREADGASGKEIGYENLVAVYNSASDTWGLAQYFDTTLLPDGFYVLVANGKDVAGNETTEIIPFSIRNWAVLELLPSTENNKAGRTMPVKFSLRVARDVDPAQPFVYSEELTIVIYKTGKPTPVLQSSNFGPEARDYRINTTQQTYITNFLTLKTPMQYTVEILRGALSIGTFRFQTTK